MKHLQAYSQGCVEEIMSLSLNHWDITVADPGFPVGGRAPVGGRGPPTWALFSENVCKNERIGFHGGGHVPGTPPRSANV